MRISSPIVCPLSPRSSLAGLVALAFSATFGCSEAPAASAAAKVMNEASPSTAIDANTFPLPKDDAELSAQLDLVCKQVAPNMTKADYHFTGTLGARGSQSHGVVLVYGRCYRVVAVGTDTLEDLDLALFDGNAVERMRDLTNSRISQLGVDPELCPTAPGAYRIDVRAFSGSGRYALQVLQTEPQI